MAVNLSDLIKSYEDSNTSGEFRTWICKIELVAKLQKVDDLTAFVPLFLNGSAFSFYEQLPAYIKNNHKLKKELLTVFSSNCYNAYAQVRERVLQQRETVDVYLSDLRRLVDATGQTNPDPILKCTFIVGLPNDVANQLKATAAAKDLRLGDSLTRARTILSAAKDSSTLLLHTTEKI